MEPRRTIGPDDEEPQLVRLTLTPREGDKAEKELSCHRRCLPRFERKKIGSVPLNVCRGTRTEPIPGAESSIITHTSSSLGRS